MSDLAHADDDADDESEPPTALDLLARALDAARAAGAARALGGPGVDAARADLAATEAAADAVVGLVLDIDRLRADVDTLKSHVRRWEQAATDYAHQRDAAREESARVRDVLRGVTRADLEAVALLSMTRGTLTNPTPETAAALERAWALLPRVAAKLAALLPPVDVPSSQDG